MRSILGKLADSQPAAPSKRWDSVATEVEPALEREFYACADPVSSCSGLLIAAGMSLHPGMQMGVRRKETSYV